MNRKSQKVTKSSQKLDTTPEKLIFQRKILTPTSNLSSPFSLFSTTQIKITTRSSHLHFAFFFSAYLDIYFPFICLIFTTFFALFRHWNWNQESSLLEIHKFSHLTIDTESSFMIFFLSFWSLFYGNDNKKIEKKKRHVSDIFDKFYEFHSEKEKENCQQMQFVKVLKPFSNLFPPQRTQLSFFN